MKVSFIGMLSLFWKGNEMELADIWEKIATNKILTPEETQFLRRSAVETQQRNSFISGNIGPDNKLSVNFPFFPIFSEVLQSDKSSISIDIPANAKHIFLIGGGRTTQAAYSTGILARFNDDTAANYRYGFEGAQNTTQIGNQVTGSTGMILGDFCGTSAQSGALGSFFAFIPHAQGGLWKNYLSLRGVGEYSATDLATIFLSAFWQNTDPIRKITVYPASGSILAGSLISIYGII